MKNSKRLLALAISTALCTPAAVYATNGMNLEGYGPEALGMGGASMAYDNGTAAMMNNPATLGLMDDGERRMDLALGFLGPDIETSMPGGKWESKSDAFYMPAAGYASKSGKLTWGVGAFAQGGMGTEYKATSPGAAAVAMSNGPLTAAPPAMGGAVMTTAMGWEEMSEVSVMRILVPLAYNVNDKFTIGGSIDYVRASMDIKMAMPGNMMFDMMPAAYNPGATNAAGELSGTMIDGLAMQIGMGNITELFGGYFDFADSNPYAGATEGDGFAGKLGFTYKINDKVSIGGSYHSKTSLGDLTGNAKVSMAIDTPVGEAVMPVNGKMTIKDFQWPETWGLGVSFQATDKLQLVADVKQINWAAVMKNFNMSFKAKAGDPSGFGGTVMDATLYQNWDDQTAFQIGGAYQVTDAFVARLGANISKNPVPDSHLNYLFPAIIENHYTAGFGYAFSDVNAIDFALSYAPEVEATSELSGLTTKHAQTSWQFLYSHNF